MSTEVQASILLLVENIDKLIIVTKDDHNQSIDMPLSFFIK